VCIFVSAIFSAVVTFVLATRGSHIPVSAESLLSEGVVSVQLTKCQLTFMDASF